jgi:flagellar protein FliT
MTAEQKAGRKMATRSEVIHCYTRLAACLALMVELARAKEWGRLPELELQCAAIVDRLKVVEPMEYLDPDQVQEARRLMERIHDDQDEVCQLVKPQLEKLVARMSFLQQQKNLDKVYGPPH